MSVGRNGVNAHATVVAGYEASAEGSAQYGPVTAAGKAQVFGGARADADLNLRSDGAALKGEAFAGAKADVSGSVEAGGVGATGKAEGWAGVGVKADVEVGMKDGKFTIGGDFGAAVGVGGSLGGSVTIDPKKVVNEIGDAAGAVGDFLTDW